MGEVYLPRVVNTPKGGNRTAHVGEPIALNIVVNSEGTPKKAFSKTEGKGFAPPQKKHGEEGPPPKKPRRRGFRAFNIKCIQRRSDQL